MTYSIQFADRFEKDFKKLDRCALFYITKMIMVIRAQVSKMISEHMVNEFNDPGNFCLIPLMFNGKYIDKRER